MSLEITALDGRRWLVTGVSELGYVTIWPPGPMGPGYDHQCGVLPRVFERETGLKIANVRAALAGEVPITKREVRG